MANTSADNNNMKKPPIVYGPLQGSQVTDAIVALLMQGFRVDQINKNVTRRIRFENDAGGVEEIEIYDVWAWRDDETPPSSAPPPAPCL